MKRELWDWDLEEEESDRWVSVVRTRENAEVNPRANMIETAYGAGGIRVRRDVKTSGVGCSQGMQCGECVLLDVPVRACQRRQQQTAICIGICIYIIGRSGSSGSSGGGGGGGSSSNLTIHRHSI